MKFSKQFVSFVHDCLIKKPEDRYYRRAVPLCGLRMISLFLCCPHRKTAAELLSHKFLKSASLPALVDLLRKVPALGTTTAPREECVSRITYHQLFFAPAPCCS